MNPFQQKPHMLIQSLEKEKQLIYCVLIIWCLFIKDLSKLNYTNSDFHPVLVPRACCQHLGMRLTCWSRKFIILLGYIRCKMWDAQKCFRPQPSPRAKTHLKTLLSLISPPFASLCLLLFSISKWQSSCKGVLWKCYITLLISLNIVK